MGHTGESAYVTYDSAGQFQIVRWNLLNGKTKPGPFGQGYLRALAVSADERWVAGARASTVRVWDFSGPKPPPRAARQFKVVDVVEAGALALSSDGAFVAFRGEGLWCGSVADGRTWLIVDDVPHDGRDLAFHPSRPVLAYRAEAEVVFYDVVARAERTRFAWGVKLASALAFSADGLRCAAVGRGKVVVWDVDT